MDRKGRSGLFKSKLRSLFHRDEVAATSKSTPSLVSKKVTSALSPQDGEDVARVLSQSFDTRLWDKAYASLKATEAKLIDDYERILFSELENKDSTSEAHLKLKDLALHQGMQALMTEKLESVKRASQFTVAGKEFELRPQIKKLVDIAVFAQSFVGSAVQASPPAAMAWAGVCMLLPLFASCMSQRTALIDGLRIVAEIMDRCMLKEHVYLKTQNQASIAYEAATVELYAKLLEYQARSIRQFSYHRLARVIKDALKLDDWIGVVSAIKDLDVKCEKLSEVIDSERLLVVTMDHKSHLNCLAKEYASLVQSLEGINNSVKLMRDDRQQGRLDVQTQEQRDCLASLLPCNYWDNLKEVLPRYAGSCEWFMRHPKYHEWLDSRTSTLLCVSADPGCGKSVLAKTLIEMDLSRVREAPTAITYFFFKDTDFERRGATSCLRAIIYQLVKRIPGLIGYVLSCIRNGQGKVFESFDDMWDLFMIILEDPKVGDIICVIDALDECQDGSSNISYQPWGSRTMFISRLSAFFRQGNVQGPRLKMIITSRPDRELEQAFFNDSKDMPIIRLMGESEAEMKAITAEISLYVEENVKRFGARRKRSGIEDDATDVLRSHLATIQNRTYLWVWLIFPELMSLADRVSRDDVIEAIYDTPDSVFTAYEAILKRLTDVEKAEKLLQIVLAAARPLSLEEFNWVFSIRDSDVTMNDVQKHLIPQSVLRTRVREICGLFVHIIDDKVHLVHQTAKEFLLAQPVTGFNDYSNPRRILPIAQKHKSWRHSISLSVSNGIIANSCVRYLTMKDFSRDLLEVAPEYLLAQKYVDYEALQRLPSNIDAYTRQYCFLTYAAQHWASHFLVAQPPAETLDSHAARQHAKLIETSSQLCRLLTPQWTLWFAVKLFTSCPLHTLLDNRFSHGYKEWRETYTKGEELPLRAMLGHQTAVTNLLSERQPRPSFISSEACYALTLAIQQGHHDIVRVLLQYCPYEASFPDDSWTKTSNPNAVGLMNETYGTGISHFRILSFAVEIGHVPTVEYMLSAWSRVSLKHTSILSIAAWQDSPSMITLLLQHGATCDNEAMRVAVRRGNLSVVETMFNWIDEHALRAEATESQGRTLGTAKHRSPLNSYYSSHPSNGDFDLSAGDTEGMTILHIAAGPPVPFINLTPMIAASSNISAEHFWGKDTTQQDDILRLLIQRGADAFALDSLFRTPLHEAIVNWRENAVRTLLGAGGDAKDQLSMQDHNGHSSLHLAALASSKEITSVLLEAGASLVAVDKRQQTALHIAAEAGRADIVEILLRCKASTVVRDHRGDTPLHPAARERHVEVVVLLLETGIDVDAKTTPYDDTPLTLAAQGGHISVVRALIQGNASLECKNAWGRTALHCAIWEDQSEITSLLIESGASIKAQDYLERTIMHSAVTQSHDKIVMTLLDTHHCLKLLGSVDLTNRTALAIAESKLQDHHGSRGYREVKTRSETPETAFLLEVKQGLAFLELSNGETEVLYSEAEILGWVDWDDLRKARAERYSRWEAGLIARQTRIVELLRSAKSPVAR